jgi:UDP-3-O-[3-hydroxymyristoyl] glucosamine N-acyltransferase
VPLLRARAFPAITVTLRDLAERLGCRLEGDGAIEIAGVAGLEAAVPGEISFFANPKYTAALQSTRASAVIVGEHAPAPPTAALRAVNPYLAFAEALDLLTADERPARGVHPSSVIAADASIGDGVSIGPFVVVGPGAGIGDRTVLHAHVVIGRGARVGPDCLLYPRVSVRERSIVGARVILQDGVVIGSDGYGFVTLPDGTHRKIPQRAVVVIEDDVEVGANTTIDRPSVGETRIQAGTKIDNLVQIAHGVRVGAHSLLAAQVGIAGSTVLGDHVTLAGQVGVAGHITIGDRVIATAQSGIPNTVEPGAVISGYPAVPNRQWLKSSAIIRHLPELRLQLTALARRLETLEARLGMPAAETRSDTDESMR